MGVINFQIIFDSPNCAYFSGGTITGKIHFYLDTPKRIKAISVNFLGVANTAWSEKETARGDDNESREHVVNFTGSEEYFSNSYNLAGGPNGDMTLLPGEHVYSFCTTLPPVLPSSLQSEHGSIRYSLQAKLDCSPWSIDNHYFEKEFTVITPVDLNLIYKAKEPVMLEEDQTFCCWCCSCGILTVAARLPHTGYVPGQAIPITIEANNASSIQVTNLSIVLGKVLKWKVSQPRSDTKEERVAVVTKNMGAVDPGASKTYSQHIVVPSLPVCNTEQCSIIKCTYDLRVIAEVSGCHNSLNLSIPIYLGTVPLNSISGQAPSGAPSAPYPTGTFSVPPPEIPPSGTFSMPAPGIPPAGIFSIPPPGVLPAGNAFMPNQGSSPVNPYFDNPSVMHV